MLDSMIGRVVLSRYRIVRSLAKGGMGVVYLARSEGASGFAKPVVVKRMVSDMVAHEDMSRMFVREARLMSRLRHPGLVSVIDFGLEHGDYVMIIEYVHGYHLGQWARYMQRNETLFPGELACQIIVRVLEGLRYVHELRGPDGKPLTIVHRDVSPSNILLDVEGHVKLADFGVARSREATEQTQEQTVKGKIPYLAPELLQLDPPSPSSDIYACAVVLHEALSGRNEFRADDPASTMARVLGHVPTPVDALRDDLPDGLGDVVARGLAKSPDGRYATAEEFAQALRRVIKTPEEQLNTKLRERMAQDFDDPNFSLLLGIQSLVERDQAWRNPPPSVMAGHGGSAAPKRSSAPPTTAARVVKPVPTRRRWLLAAGAGALVALASGGMLLAVQDNNAGTRGPTYVVVTGGGQRDSGPGRPAGEDAGAQIGTDEDVAPTPTPDAGAPARVRDAGRGGGSTSVTSLSGAFSRRRGEVVACFRNHGEGRSELSVRFTLDEGGAIVRAQVIPASVAGTPLGQCVEGVARSTTFPPQPRAVTFTIPVSVRSVAPGR